MFSTAGLARSSPRDASDSPDTKLAFLGVLILVFAVRVSASADIQPFSHYLFESVKGAMFFTVVFLMAVLIIAEIYYRFEEGVSLWPR